MPTIQATLAAERAQYGERLTAAEAVEILTRTAAPYAAEYGLLQKTSGNNWGGKAVDILAHVGGDHHYDVLIDSPDVTVTPPYLGTCQPAVAEDGDWSQDKGPYDPTRFVSVTPAPPPDPTPDDHAAIWAALVGIRNDLNAVLAQIRALVAIVDAHGDRLTALEQAPPPTLPPFTVTGQTSRTLYHTHAVTVTYPPA